MERRVTIRDIAKALGCHHSTVSLALRDDFRLPSKTRHLVQNTAEKMGYRPDPMVQALAAYRSAIKPTADHGTLAWLSNESAEQIGPNYAFSSYVNGARERASELGFKIEEFALRAPNMTPHRMVQILQNRGITGVLVAPQPIENGPVRLELDWSTFSAVAIGYSLIWPRFHLVSNHQFDTVKIAYRNLLSLGYRRIGFCMDRVVNERCNGGFIGGYFSECASQPVECHLRPFLYEKWNAPDLRSWFRANKPEAIIVHDSIFAEKAVETLRLRTPEKIGVVCLHRTSRSFAHVDQNTREIGAAAVDLLVSMIYRNERGIPRISHQLLIESVWRDGPSVRPVH